MSWQKYRLHPGAAFFVWAYCAIISREMIEAHAIPVIVQVVGLGVFIGVTKASQAAIASRLQRLEEKLDRHNEEISSLRERVAVLESKNK